MLKIEKAKEELSKKSYRDIQEETAWTWASRACASYSNVLYEEVSNKISILMIAEEYAHESIEHASLVSDNSGPSLLRNIQDSIAPFSSAAYKDVELFLGIKL